MGEVISPCGTVPFVRVWQAGLQEGAPFSRLLALKRTIADHLAAIRAALSAGDGERVRRHGAAVQRLRRAAAQAERDLFHDLLSLDVARLLPPAGGRPAR